MLATERVWCVNEYQTLNKSINITYKTDCSLLFLKRFLVFKWYIIYYYTTGLFFFCLALASATCVICDGYFVCRLYIYYLLTLPWPSIPPCLFLDVANSPMFASSAGLLVLRFCNCIRKNIRLITNVTIIKKKSKRTQNTIQYSKHPT